MQARPTLADYRRIAPTNGVSPSMAKSPLRQPQPQQAQAQSQAQATIRTMRDPLQAVNQQTAAGGQPMANQANAGSSSDLGSRPSRQPSAGSSTVPPSVNGTSNGQSHSIGQRLSARPQPGVRPSSAQSVQSSASTNPGRSMSSQPGQASQAKPDLRRWTDEDLRRQIQMLEKGLKSASTGGSASKSIKPPAGMGTAQVVTNAVSGSAGGTRSPSPLPPESTSNSGVTGQREDKATKPQSPSTATGDSFVPDKLEEELSMKERQVVQLRAQIARREKQLSSRQRMVVDGSELEHPDPERTGPPALGSGATTVAATGSTATGNAITLNNLVSASLGERFTGGSTAGANTPTVASTPGGRETVALEAELSWIVRQMEGHRKQITEHQSKLTTLEKRHAELIAALSAHGLGGGRSPASTAAERLEFEEGAIGYDAIQQRLGLHKELIEAACMDRRETGSNIDDPLNMSMCSSTLSGSNKRMLQFVPGRGSRPTSAGSGTSAGSREVGSIRGSAVGSAVGERSARGSYGSALGLKARNNGSACSSITGPPTAPASSSRHKLLQAEPSECSVTGSVGPVSGPPSEGGDGFSTASWTGAPGSEPSRSFGKSYEAERIVYLLTQFGMKRPLRVPFVPLDAALDGEGRPYLHGALEVRLCLSEDGNRLMVRVGSGPSGVGGRLFEIDEFVNRAEAIEARRSHRPTPIAEDSVPQMEPVPNVSMNTSIGPDITSPRFAGLAAGSELEDTSLMSSIIGRGKDDINSSLPWKKLFKSHWGS